MATGQQSWVEDMYDVIVHWHEFCSAGTGPAPTPENFVLRPVWHKRCRALAFVHPMTQHISVVGEGLYAKTQELKRLAVHAFRTDLGDALCPPPFVRMGGARLAFAGWATATFSASRARVQDRRVTRSPRWYSRRSRAAIPSWRSMEGGGS